MNVYKMTNRELDDVIEQRESPPRTPFQRVNTNDLMAMKFPPIRSVVPGYVIEGFNVLAGRQKLGKTWLGIDWATALATGGTAMGSIDCTAGDVLYIDCENGQRRVQNRIHVLYPNERDRPDLSRLEWMTEAPQINNGLLDLLDRWRLSVQTPRLVVIDVLQRVKPAATGKQNAYEADYSIFAPLQQWATVNQVAVLGLHHTKKGGADDPLEALSGSNGLAATADNVLVLDSGANGKTLYVRGRDIEEKETALVFTGGLWSILGEASTVRLSAERKVIVDTITDNQGPMTIADIAAATGKKHSNIKQLLFSMGKAGEVKRAGRGEYGLPQ